MPDGWKTVEEPAATTGGGWKTVDEAPAAEAPKPGDWQSQVKPVKTHNGKDSVQRYDGGVWYGPEQGNPKDPGWFDAEGNRLPLNPEGDSAFLRKAGAVAHTFARPFERTLEGSGQLMTRALGDQQQAQDYQSQINGNEQDFKDNAYHGRGSGLLEFGGAVMQPFPGMRGLGTGAKLSSRVLQGAMVGGGAAGLQSVYGDAQNFGRDKLVNTTIGTALGAAAPAVLDKVVTPAANRVASAIQRIKALRGGALPAEAQAVQDLGDQFGVRTLAPDMVPSPAMNKLAVLAESVPGSGMVAERQAQQSEAMAAAQKLLEKHGIEGDASAKIQQGMATKLAQGKANSSTAYDLVAKLAEGKGEVPLDQTLAAIQKFKAQEAASAIPDQSLLGLLDKLETRLTSPEAGVDKSFTGVRALRSDLGNMISDYYKGTNAATGSKGVGVLQGVKGAIEGDLGAFTSQNGPELAKAAKAADGIYRGQVVPFKDSMIAKAVKGSEPDQVYGAFIQAGKGDRAQKFYNALDPEGQAAVRSQMVQNAFNEATKKEGTFSPAQFAASLEKIKDASGVFFKGADKFELDGFTKLMRHIQRAGQIGENPTNGQRMVQTLIAGEGIGGAAAAVTGHPAALVAPAGSMLSARVMTKMFSSAAGKRFLLKASDLQPGSKALNTLIEQDLPKVLGVEATATAPNVTPLRINSPKAAQATEAE